MDTVHVRNRVDAKILNVEIKDCKYELFYLKNKLLSYK